MPSIMEVHDLSLSFGGHVLLKHVSFNLHKGEIILLHGQNGSGKTTLLNVLSGFIKPDSGKINMVHHGKQIDISRMSAERVASYGVCKLWQDIRLFPTMKVIDNVMAATPCLSGMNPLLSIILWLRVKRQEKNAKENAIENLTIMGIADRSNSSADKLSVGQMKRVAIARLLQTGAEVLLLDEPLAGLDEISSAKLMETIDYLAHKGGKTILIVEHKSDEVYAICDKVWCLSNGDICETMTA